MASFADATVLTDAAPAPPLASVAANIARWVRDRPDAPAVILGAETMTYAALDAAANRFARRLLEAGTKGDRVAHLMPDGPSVFVALLGALKAGRINHVLNHRDPLPRLLELVGDSEPEAIVTAEPHVELAMRLAGSRTRVIRADESLAGLPATSPEVPIAPADGAYLVYTSGSTGKPKAVLQAHAHIVRAALALREVMAVAPEDRIVLVASLWGGQATNTMWSTFFSGATLLPFPTVDYGVTGLEAWLADNRITIFISASSLLRRFMKTLAPDSAFPLVRMVKVSSDVATWDDFRAFLTHFPNGRLLSTMGASEVGNIACALLDRDSPQGTGPLPVGRAFPGLEIRILGPDGNQVPPGETGQLAIGSPSLFDSYWRDPTLTAKYYVALPEGIRMFRSDDLGRVDGNGNIFHAGRRDATYKIRGQRVDIAEVERFLIGLPGIEEAAAVALPRADGEAQLVGYVVARGGVMPSPRRVRGIARGFMPRHMVPSVFVPMAALPRTANGKVDRGRLRAIAPARAATASAGPETATERLLAGFWEEAFDLEGIGRDDDFFDLGGDSLIAAMVTTRIDAALGLQLPFQALVENPILKDLAAAIDTGTWRPATDERLVAVPRNGPIALSLFQEPYWRTSRTPQHSRRYTRAATSRLDGPLDVGAFRAALEAVLVRHEILRTRFAVVDGDPVQVIEPPGPLHLEVTDLRGHADPEAVLTERIIEEGGRVFDLLGGPALEFRLFRLAETSHVLVRTSHHILTDAPSWNIFLRDLGGFYAARVEGTEPALPEMPVQFGDFAVWHRKIWRRGGRRFEEATAWLMQKLLAEPRPLNLRTVPGYLRKRPLGDGEPRSRRDWGLEPATSERLDALAHAEAATPYMVRLACLVPVVADIIQHDAVTIGGVFTNRNNAALEPVFGPLANFVPLVIRCDRRATFREHLRTVRAEVLDAHRFADVPLAELASALAECGVDLPPLFLWVHVPTATPPMAIAGVSMRPERTARPPGGSGVVIVRFNLLAEETGSSVTIDPRIYTPELLDDLATRLGAFAAAAAADPDARLADIMAAATADGAARAGATAPRR